MAGADPIDPSEADQWWLEVNRGKELMESQQLQEARDILNHALNGLEKLYGKNSAEIVPAISMLAMANGKLRETRLQESLYKRALKLVGKRYADLSYEAGHSLLQYSFNRKTGLSMLQDALDVYVNLVDSSEPMSAQTSLALGELVLRSGHFQAAQHFFKRAQKNLDDEEGLVSVNDRIRAHSGLVSAYVLGGESELASESCREVSHWTYATAPTVSDSEIVRVDPMYPWNLIMTGIEGYVDFEFTVDEQGFVLSPRVIDVEGHDDFVPAALRALCSYTFNPRPEIGDSVPVENVKKRISFEID